MDFSKFRLALVDENLNVVTDQEIINKFFDEREKACSGTHILTIDEIPYHDFALKMEDNI